MSATRRINLSNQQSTIGNQFIQHSAFSILRFARTIQLPARLQQGGRDCTAAFHWNKRGTSSSAAVNSITSMPFWRYYCLTGSLIGKGLMLRCAKWATDEHSRRRTQRNTEKPRTAAEEHGRAQRSSAAAEEHGRTQTKRRHRGRWGGSGGGQGHSQRWTTMRRRNC